jgi:oxygen-independent coproporphyrinogen III oxidase
MSGQLNLSKVDDLVSLYFHIPFCIRRCNYCDFNTYAHQEHFIPDYVEALCKEINQLGSSVQEKVHTIYFGGGTPSVLQTYFYIKIFDAIHNNFKLISNPEISMEVNPGTVQPGFFENIYSLGVNRLSIGLQSAILEELSYLGRIHSPLEAIETVKMAQNAGFKNISLDLMFGLPGQTIYSWHASLDFALKLKPSHLSLYSLSYEKGTRLNGWRIEGLLPVELEDLPADLYELAIENLHKNNFLHYEISNWASIDKQNGELNICRHNMQYWLNEPYLGIGAGAHSCYHGFRSENVKTIKSYINASKMDNKKLPSFAQIKKVRLTPRVQMQETMLMGLRLLLHGVSNSDFQKRFDCSIYDVFRKEITELTNLGLVTWKGKNNDHLCLTRRGCMLGNQVFQYFVD